MASTQLNSTQFNFYNPQAPSYSQEAPVTLESLNKSRIEIKSLIVALNYDVAKYQQNWQIAIVDVPTLKKSFEDFARLSTLYPKYQKDLKSMPLMQDINLLQVENLMAGVPFLNLKTQFTELARDFKAGNLTQHVVQQIPKIQTIDTSDQSFSTLLADVKYTATKIQLNAKKYSQSILKVAFRDLERMQTRLQSLLQPQFDRLTVSNQHTPTELDVLAYLGDVEIYS